MDDPAVNAWVLMFVVAAFALLVQLVGRK